jgi:hypothetical protein
MSTITFETDISGFPKGYGRFPYLIVKAVNTAPFIQVPIRLGNESDRGDFEGTLISDFPYTEADLSKDEVADLWIDHLIHEAEKEYQKRCAEAKREFYVFAVLSPDISYGISKNGKYFASTIPSGDSLKTVNGFEIKTLHGRHFLYSELGKYQNKHTWKQAYQKSL